MDKWLKGPSSGTPSVNAKLKKLTWTLTIWLCKKLLQQYSNIYYLLTCSCLWLFSQDVVFVFQFLNTLLLRKLYIITKNIQYSDKTIIVPLSDSLIDWSEKSPKNTPLLTHIYINIYTGGQELTSQRASFWCEFQWMIKEKLRQVTGSTHTPRLGVKKKTCWWCNVDTYLMRLKAGEQGRGERVKWRTGWSEKGSKWGPTSNTSARPS